MLQFFTSNSSTTGHAQAPIFSFDHELIADTLLYNKNAMTGIIAPNNFRAAFLITGLLSKIAMS